MYKKIITYILIILCLLIGYIDIMQAGNLQNAITLRPRNTDYNQVEFKEEKGEWVIITKGNDPYIFFDTSEPVDFSKQYMLSFESFNTTESLPMVIFVGSQLDWDHLVEGYNISRTEGWTSNGYDLSVVRKSPSNPFTSVRIRFGNSGKKSLRIRKIELREPTAQELELIANRERRLQEDEAFSTRLRSYLQKDFSSEILSVHGTYHLGEMEIKGVVRETITGNIGLAEVPLWEDATRLSAPVTFIPLENGSFSHRVARMAEDQHDRFLSGWAIVRKKSPSGYELLSAVHYADEIEPRDQLEKMIPRSLKGIGGCPFDHPDMKELGIASVTFNILLDRILFLEDAPGRTPYHYAGKTWYVDMEGELKGIDRDMKIAQENGWMVSAILLIPVNRAVEKDSWTRRVAHSEALTSGAFAMPNMTDKEAVEAYAATMNFLTERYSTPQYGRIHHWIIHNEIQNGFFWTSAGSKGIETYMNLYQKSMRLVYTLARQYDPNAKVLISLDHDWFVTSDMRGYKGKELLDLLVEFSHQEGDFEWGIAQHPYPQDINNPRTWEDDKAVLDFKTPYLTPKNLEVLDAWVSQPHVLFRGNPREIQFTEQGLNSPDYSEKSLIDQAAGMAYTWEKLKRMKNVTAYQYHLWADAYEEGGLKLGLRKYYNAEGDPHGKKPIWYLYRSLDTPEYGKVREAYKRVIGIDYWDEVYFGAEGWQLLFDGQTTNGWHSFNNEKVLPAWRVENGELVLRITDDGERGWDLVTDEEFEDFDLRLEWKISKGGNSGIFFGVKEGPEYGWASSTGVEMQVLDNIEGADRGNPKHLAGAMYDLIDASNSSKPRPVGQWNEVRIFKNDGKVTFWLNGIITAQIDMNSVAWKELVNNSKWNGADQYNGSDFGKFSKGRIALQDHFDGVYYRNIRIKRL